MTVLVAGVSLGLALLLTTFFGDIAAVVGARVRAQAAADAAALAAVAENIPGEDGRTRAEAERFAAANGGTLVDCTCAPGLPAVELVVEVEGVRARSRAVVDAARLAPAGPGASSEGLDPRLEEAVGELIAHSGGAIRLVSGWRSTAGQRDLWNQALARYGSAERADDWVAPPGHSFHEKGLAVDLGGDLEAAAALIDELGLPLYRPLPNEPWHFELVGSRG